MPTRHITKRSVSAAKPGPADSYLWDDELAGFGLKITPAGNLQYKHPENYFDDSIMALGLCALPARVIGRPGRRMDSDYLGGDSGKLAVPEWFERIN